jgi:photosystem II PsbW protein
MSLAPAVMNATRIISSTRGLPSRRFSAKPVVARADVRSVKTRSMKSEIARLTTVIGTMQTFPALAIVDDRLNGDGTGLPLGINDGALGIILATVPLAIFSLYFIAGKQDDSIIAGGKDDESGLSL